ncbi:MAG: hypothetical protein AAFN81_07655 [Bacteroidota bacterium]
MDLQDFPWEAQPQETTGTYRFDGRFSATVTVMADLGEQVIAVIYMITQALVKKQDGLDYILAFKHKDTGVVVWFIDQLNDEMKRDHYTPEQVAEYNVCTLCYPEER